MTSLVPAILLSGLMLATASLPGQTGPTTPEPQPPETATEELSPTTVQQPERDPTQPSSAMLEALSRPPRAQGDEPGRPRQSHVLEVVGQGEMLERVHCEDAPLALVAKELVRASGWNIVVSAAAARKKLDFYVQNLAVGRVVELIAESQGLVLRRDRSNAVLRLIEAGEYDLDFAALREDATEVFTLLYPNATDVASALANVYGNRMVVSYGNEERETLTDLQQRFNRFDVLDGRGQGLGRTFGGNTSVRSGGAGLSGNTNNQAQTSGQRRLGTGNQQFRDRNAQQDRALRAELGPAQLQALEDEAAESEDGVSPTARRLATGAAPIHVTVLRRLNRVVVRTSDSDALEGIGQLVRRLDVPTPLVLLEVKVLRIELGNDISAGLDVAFSDGNDAGGFTRGNILLPDDGGLIPAGTGFDASAALFQIVSSRFAARLEALERDGRVTALATPLILTANAEVSRIFSGQRVPVVVGFSEPQLLVGDGATASLQASPITELTDVGTQLLLTANINADRTVTLRLLQESSTLVPDGAEILVPVGNSIAERAIDVVQTQTSSGTIVGQDGKLMVFGGLIEEVDSDQRTQIPLLGDIPLIGFLFKRHELRVSRTELIVTVRPHVLVSPAESERKSQELLESLSTHPEARRGDPGTLDSFGPDDALPPREARRHLRRLFNFHVFSPGSSDDHDQQP